VIHFQAEPERTQCPVLADDRVVGGGIGSLLQAGLVGRTFPAQVFDGNEEG